MIVKLEYSQSQHTQYVLVEYMLQRNLTILWWTEIVRLCWSVLAKSECSNCFYAVISLFLNVLLTVVCWLWFNDKNLFLVLSLSKRFKMCCRPRVQNVFMYKFKSSLSAVTLKVIYLCCVLSCSVPDIWKRQTAVPKGTRATCQKFYISIWAPLFSMVSFMLMTQSLFKWPISRPKTDMHVFLRV